MTTRRDVLALAALGVAAGAVRPARAAAPAGQLTVGVHITLAPTWLDPAETAGIITPFMVLYALHDAVAKPMPQGNPITIAGGILVCRRGRTELRVRAARRGKIPQRRSGHRR